MVAVLTCWHERLCRSGRLGQRSDPGGPGVAPRCVAGVTRTLLPRTGARICTVASRVLHALAAQEMIPSPLGFTISRGFIKVRRECCDRHAISMALNPVSTVVCCPAQKLCISIPWTSLLSQPIEVSLSRLECILTARAPAAATTSDAEAAGTPAKPKHSSRGRYVFRRPPVDPRLPHTAGLRHSVDGHRAASVGAQLETRQRRAPCRRGYSHGSLRSWPT